MSEEKSQLHISSNENLSHLNSKRATVNIAARVFTLRDAEKSLQLLK